MSFWTTQRGEFSALSEGLKVPKVDEGKLILEEEREKIELCKFSDI